MFLYIILTENTSFIMPTNISTRLHVLISFLRIHYQLQQEQASNQTKRSDLIEIARQET